MGLSEAEYRQLLANQQAAKATDSASAALAIRTVKPIIRVELGEWIAESFFIAGSIPSKKNRKRAIIKTGPHGPVPGLITDGDVQKQLAALTNQCSMYWTRRHKWPLTNATVSLQFCVSHMRQDLDNAQCSMADCLVKAEVLRDDSMKHLHLWEKVGYQIVERGKEGVWVSVKGQEYIEKVVGQNAA